MAIMHDRIKELRNTHGYTLSMIAEKLGVTEATAQRYETGKGIKTIPYDVIEKYANIFCCSPSYIMGWDQDEIEAISEQIDDKNGYIDHVELALKALFEEFGRLHLSYEDIQLIKDYSNSVKGNEELYRYMAKARRRFVELQLNEEETEEMIKYAEFLVSKRKKG